MKKYRSKRAWKSEGNCTRDTLEDIRSQLNGDYKFHAYKYPKIGDADVRKILHDAVVVSTPNYPMGETEYINSEGVLVKEHLFVRMVHEDSLIPLLKKELEKVLEPSKWDFLENFYAYPHGIPAMVYCEDVEEPRRGILKEVMGIFMNNVLIPDELARESRKKDSQVSKEEVE